LLVSGESNIYLLIVKYFSVPGYEINIPEFNTIGFRTIIM